MGLFGLPIYALGGNGFDPGTLSLTAWLRNYSGDPWSGTTSVGTSGSNTFTDAVNAPATGTALNGSGTADFASVNTLTPDGTVNTYFDSYALSGWVLTKLDSATSPYFLYDINAIFSLYASSSTLYLELNLGATSVSKAISTGSWALVTFRYDGSDLQIGVNEAPGASGGGSTTSYTDSLSNLTGTLTFGADLDGLVAEVGLSDTALTNQDFADIQSYVNRRYGLSL